MLCVDSEMRYNLSASVTTGVTRYNLHKVTREERLRRISEYSHYSKNTIKRHMNEVRWGVIDISKRIYHN